MKLESDVDQVYTALVLLEMSVNMIKISRLHPLDQRITYLKESISHIENVQPHPSMRWPAEIVVAALRGELNRITEVKTKDG